MFGMDLSKCHCILRTHKKRSEELNVARDCRMLPRLTGWRGLSLALGLGLGLSCEKNIQNTCSCTVTSHYARLAKGMACYWLLSDSRKLSIEIIHILGRRLSWDAVMRWVGALRDDLVSD